MAVDRDAEIPIGVQLAWALRTRIRDGQLAPGERLPGLREVAQATGVNVNTVRAVYQRLEQEGLIDSQQGSGTFVAATLQRRSTVATIAADAAREAHETGVDPREVAAALYVTPASVARSSTAAAIRRRALREQIAALERTLGEMEAKHPGVAPASSAGRREIGPALLDVAELERVRTLLVRRLSVVQAAVDRLSCAEIDEEAERAATERAGAKRKARARPRSRPAPAGA
jgi:DNA-binding transcriptional regulator YhcF (GntR family)